MSTNHRSVRPPGSSTGVKKAPRQSSSKRSYDVAVEYFWVKLYGQVMQTWNDLPEELRMNIFPKIGINNLSDQNVQELFAIRGNNNKDSLVDKLKYLRT